eukprot:GHVU01083550.1.p1 GENE.GHVU01083550.1~~GHVU01083550.1.p1  ORF type:complete len:160 (+),score=10.16 GHVU01083550.1:1-480(+)
MHEQQHRTGPCTHTVCMNSSTGQGHAHTRYARTAAQGHAHTRKCARTCPLGSLSHQSTPSRLTSRTPAHPHTTPAAPDQLDAASTTHRLTGRPTIGAVVRDDSLDAGVALPKPLQAARVDEADPHTQHNTHTRTHAQTHTRTHTHTHTHTRVPATTTPE